MVANYAIVYFGKNVWAARRRDYAKQKFYYYKMKEALHEMQGLEHSYQSLVLENTDDLSNFMIGYTMKIVYQLL